jgi:uncharacterized protein YraI
MPNNLTNAYRVNTAITAVKYSSDGRSRFVTIPRGVVIMVNGTPNGFNFLNVEFEGETLAIFPRDIEQHAEQVRDAG